MVLNGKEKEFFLSKLTLSFFFLDKYKQFLDFQNMFLNVKFWSELVNQISNTDSYIQFTQSTVSFTQHKEILICVFNLYVLISESIFFN